MDKPNYAKWIREEMWTLREAAYLLSDLEPDLNERGKAHCLDASKTNKVFDIYNSLKKARDKRSLNVTDTGVVGRWIGDATVDPSHCIQWALKRGIELPEKLRPLGTANESTERTDRTQLKIIGALLKVLLGKQPSGKAYSVLKKQESIIEAVLMMYPDERGLSKRTLESVFAQANKALSAE